MLDDELKVMKRNDIISLAVSCISFSYPIRIVTRMIYSKLTDRTINMKSEDWIDLIFFGATFTWAADLIAFEFFEK